MAIDLKSLKPFAEAASADQLDLPGTWTNELGSTMIIDEYSPTTGNFSGTYCSSVSTNGPAVTGVLSGTVSGSAIGFFVNWGSGSVTSWAGPILDAGNDNFVFYTLWHLATTPTEQNPWWETILAGADLFYKTSPARVNP